MPCCAAHLRHDASLKASLKGCQQVVQPLLPIEHIFLAGSLRVQPQQRGAGIQLPTVAGQLLILLPLLLLGGGAGGGRRQLSIGAAHQRMPASLIWHVPRAVALQLERPSSRGCRRLHCI